MFALIIGLFLGPWAKYSPLTWVKLTAGLSKIHQGLFCLEYFFPRQAWELFGVVMTRACLQSWWY
jgi:hypothetical protein